ncbi:MAG: hypothetical protein PW734_05480 [Verrucomicrobium sp.]|nr:hypothetical protein [Verrucomicrobium sp.]
MLRKLLRSAVAWGTLSLGLRALNALIVLPLLVRLTPSTLGIWYLFLNILPLTILFDLGFGPIFGRALTQSAHPDTPGFFGHTPADLIHTARVFYRWMAAGCFLSLSLGGGAWLAWKTVPLAHSRTVLLAWSLFCPVFAFTVALNFRRALFFGLNAVRSVQLALAAGQGIQIIVTWYGLLHGWGLYALAGGNTLMTATSLLVLLLLSRQQPDVRKAAAQPGRFEGRIFFSLWSASWRVFLNLTGIYLGLNALVLAGSASLPLSTIASYGLTMQILLLGSQAAGLWMEVKQPLYAPLYASDLPALRRLFFSRLRLLLATMILFTTALAAAGPPLLTLIHAKTPLLSLAPLGTLALYLLLYLHQSQFESLGVCLNRNSFFLPLLLSGAISCGAAFMLASRFGVWGLILGPLAVQAAFNNWWIVAQGMRIMGLAPHRYFPCLFSNAALLKP